MVVKRIDSFLDVNSFPPGSNRVFIDTLIKQGKDTNDAANNAEDAINLANEAKGIAQSAQQLAGEAMVQATLAYSLADTQRIRNDGQDSRLTVIENDIDYLIDKTTDLETRTAALEAWRVYMTRQKSEVVYSGISLVIPTTSTNFFTLLNTLTPTSGTPAPFFQLAAGRLQALNKDRDLKIKFTLEGTFAGAVLNRSLAFTFGTPVPDTIYINRNTALAADSMNLNTFFAVEMGDTTTSPGVTCMVQAVGGAFTCSRIKIIATQ